MDNEPKIVYYELALCSTGQVVAIPVDYAVEVVDGIAQREVNKAKGVQGMKITLNKSKLIEKYAEINDGVVKVYNVWFFEGENPEEDSIQFLTKENLTEMLAMFN